MNSGDNGLKSGSLVAAGKCSFMGTSIGFHTALFIASPLTGAGPDYPDTATRYIVVASCILT